MQVTGEESSGEAEFVLVKDAGEVYVGVASDHTDRQVETYGITVSKQMCDKPCSNTLWRLSDVAGHWDNRCCARTRRSTASACSIRRER